MIGFDVTQLNSGNVIDSAGMPGFGLLQGVERVDTQDASNSLNHLHREQKTVTMDKEVNPRFEPFLWDWYYRTYVLIGAYGSSKSYHVALKIILKCLQEKRKVLVVRQVYETIRESCYDLFTEILDSMDLLADEGIRYHRKRVCARVSPMMLRFPNGSRIIFKGMDKPHKLKSINDVSIVWVEEAPEMSYAGYKELLGRARHPELSIHFILSFNPTDIQSWVFRHFFMDEINKRYTLDPEDLYAKKTLVKKGVYYHHSLPTDNLFLPASYVKQLDELKAYDPDLYRIARLGRFGINGLRVLPQCEQMQHSEIMAKVRGIPEDFKFNGMDFGFEESYNAMCRFAVDDNDKVLYIYHEYYANHKTDPETAADLAYMKDETIVADNEDPKAIRYYNMSGFTMRKCRSKFKGSRLSNTRKMKRFKRIVISTDCPNTWREWSTLTYKTDKDGNMAYDEFNCDPHTFSAAWYALDLYEVPDLKEVGHNSYAGLAA